MTKQMSSRDYVKQNGLKCPNCGSEEISACGNHDVSTKYSYKGCKCFYCGAQWNDVYKLIGYEDLEV